MDEKTIFAVVFLIFLIIIGGFFIKWASDYANTHNVYNSNSANSLKYPAEKFVPVGRKTRTRGKKVKFGTNVRRRDYNKSSGDIVDEFTQKINDL